MHVCLLDCMLHEVNKDMNKSQKIKSLLSFFFQLGIIKIVKHFSVPSPGDDLTAMVQGQWTKTIKRRKKNVELDQVSIHFLSWR